MSDVKIVAEEKEGEKLKILFITPRFPFPPNRGDRLRYFNFARVLSKKHSLSLLSFIESKEELDFISDFKGIFDNIETILLKPWKSYLNMIVRLFSKLPLQVSYFYSKKMYRKIEEILKREKFDVIYTFHLRMAPYASEIVGIYKVLDFTDTVSLFLRRMIKHRNLFLRPILYREYLSTKWYEPYLIERFDECWLISNIDKEAMNLPDSTSNIVLVPNGIDTEYFVRGAKEVEGRENEKGLIFVGYMGVESVDAIFYFYDQILPTIEKEVSDLKFYIVGASPPDKVKSLSRNKNIIVTGYVEDLRVWYNKASVAIAPMRFVAGMQNKILEAMAMSLPVVTTSYGNEGINAKDGEEIFIEDKPEIFAQKIMQLLKNENLRKEMGNRARKFVEEKYSWNVILNRVEEIERKIKLQKSGN